MSNYWKKELIRFILCVQLILVLIIILFLTNNFIVFIVSTVIGSIIYANICEFLDKYCKEE